MFSLFIRVLATISFLSLYGTFAHGKDTLTINYGKERVKKLSKADFKKGLILLNEKYVGSVDMTLYNAWRDYYRTYRGYSLRELLNAQFGDSWKKARLMTFVAADGYRQTSKISDLLKAMEKHEGIVAYTETGKDGFSSIKKPGKSISLEPFYLVWSGFQKGTKAKHQDLLKWPYQLVEIKLID